MAEERNGGCARDARSVSASVRPAAASVPISSGGSGATAASIFVRATSTVSLPEAGSARSAGIACDPRLGFLEARDDFHDRARAVTAIELRANQPVPAVAASTVGSGQCVDHGTAGNPRTSPGLHGGDPDRFVRGEMPQHGEAFELLLEQLTHRLRRDVAPGQARAAGADDHIHARIVDPAAQLLLDRKSTRLNSSHEWISYAVFCLKKKTR